MAAPDDEPAGGLFVEPEGFFQQEPQGKEETHERSAPRPGQPQRLTLRLAAKHSLWGHELWNAARFLAGAMESGELAVEGACVLELGAGAGLPSLTASLCGARAVAATDYGTASDDALIQALRCNAATLAAQRAAAPACADWRCDVAVAPFVWGSDVAPLLALLPPGCAAFDRIVLADLLFNRQSHKQLLTTCQECLAPGGVVWVAYSHHDPHKAALDNAFWALAAAPPFSFAVRHERDIRFERDLFIENDGLDDARAVVYFYTLTHQPEDARRCPISVFS